MSLYISSINSGSNGNCYYVGTQQEAVLVDAGLSARTIEKRMQDRGLSMKLVKAIFVTHEHTDHIKGVSTLANKYMLPVYISPGTAKKGPHMIKRLSKSFNENEPVSIGNLMVTGFKKHHDAADPYSFIVTYNNITIGVFTDIGKVCHRLQHYFKQCHAAFLESNYDELMLEQGHYPVYLKNRIRGGDGHLSNKEALELFIHHRSPSISHLLLSHLSKDNNDPELAVNLFKPYAGNTHIIAASRYAASDVYQINGTLQSLPVIPRKALQLGLFE